MFVGDVAQGMARDLIKARAHTNKANEALETERALRVSAEEKTVRIQGRLNQSSRPTAAVAAALGTPRLQLLQGG